jgi:hypothetical protein
LPSGRPIGDKCGAENPDTRVHSVQTRDIFVHFAAGESCFAQAMDLDPQIGANGGVSGNGIAEQSETLSKTSLRYRRALPRSS